MKYLVYNVDGEHELVAARHDFVGVCDLIDIWIMCEVDGRLLRHVCDELLFD